MKTRITFFIYCCALIGISGFFARVDAQDYVGASAVLQQVQERGAKSTPQTNDMQSRLRNDLKAFRQNVTNLSPADAAKSWLEFVDLAAKLQQMQQMGGQNFNSFVQPIQGEDLLAALPPPGAWNELAKAIAARPPAKEDGEMRELGLRLLAATLMGNVQARNLEMTNLEAKASEADAQASQIYREYLVQFGQTMQEDSDDPNAILNSLERQLDAATRGNPVRLMVPNLVSQVGTEKADAFLRKALLTPNVSLEFGTPNQTSRLAQKLALELIDQLKMPQWGLVNSLDAVPLYEAMDKRFGTQASSSVLPGLSTVFDMSQSDFNGDLKSAAQIYYMLGLISEGRTQDAVAVAKKCKASQDYQFDNAFQAMDQAGYANELDDFLYELLSQNPTLPFWGEYVQFSAKAGKTERMLALVQSTLNRGDLSENKKVQLRQIYFMALLAADNVDEGVQELRRFIASSAPLPQTLQQNYNPGQLGALLARIGLLMTNQDWVDQGIIAATNWLATPAQQNSPDNQVIASLVQTLWELKRGPEAEAILTDALANATHPGNSQNDYSWNGETPARQILSMLTVLYYKAGRYEDVLYLLQNSPDWGAKDLSDLFDDDPWDDQYSVMSLHTGSSSLPIPYVAAVALKAKGRTEEARRITDVLLNQEPALDRGYELLIAFDGTNAIPCLDELFSWDQFQTRPLIWKAYLLEQEGQWEEAEKAVRQAIVIDPSDSESGRGDRMRAYAELADIREARGDQKEADFYRQIVQAIRVSEDADQYYEAGLLKRAIAMYEEGLDHFSDAYCIQSRLAIQLAALGKTAEAAEHYRRAYELMPDSFGRVESHCFGCERVFEGQQAQSIAEKVFTQLVAERPNKPQVYYLLGYLQSEEDRNNEAWTNFSTAVRLDPDYLNAWVKMQDVSREILVSPEERNRIAFNILRLDPLQRHSGANFSGVSDLPGLWDAVAVAVALQPKPASNLLPLPASQIALEKKVNGSNAQAAMQFQMMQSQVDDQSLSPAHAVAQTPYVMLAGELILGGESGGMDE
jgi:tetratricopeptide (TPR) repeat protein